MKDINFYIKALIDYATRVSLISEYDRVFCTNKIIEALGLNEYSDPDSNAELSIEEILCGIDDYAFEHKLFPENTVTYRDLFDTKLMGLLTPLPSVVIDKFNSLLGDSKQAATDYYYSLAKSSDYIRTYRVCRDVRYKYPSEYGDIDITINLSKPEKTPAEIAAARLAKKSGYPACLLCRENEGYAGTPSHPARQNHRIIPVDLAGKRWYMQYSPYVYYNEHCIVFAGEHIPMRIDRSTFTRQLDFVEWLPHYFIGSNADLPIVGGSILSHDHMQGGHYTFAMENAPIELPLEFDGYDDVEGGIVRWPMSVIRLRCRHKDTLVDLADKILLAWRSYNDTERLIFSQTDGEPHNTITPIARFKNGKYELDLVLRNNMTTSEHPFGLYHPHIEHHNIKKENIGLIEVMGLAVLPARLKTEMQRLSEFAVKGLDPATDAELEKHANWFESFANRYTFKSDNALGILYTEIGKTFVKVLEDAGVYKRTADGRLGFLKFASAVGAKEKRPQ